MAILVNDETRFLIQGITGREGSHFTQQMISYGTAIVAGVTPEKGGGWLHGVPIFDNVRTAVAATGADTSLVFVNPAAAADAIYEAIDEKMRLIVCVTSGIPIRDALRLRAYLASRPATRLIGPSSPGLLVPGRANAGITPLFLGTPGKVGIVSRSASLAYEVMAMMNEVDIGQSTFVGIGGDAVIGTSLADILMLFEDDTETHVVLLIGEIGGSGEQDAAEVMRDVITKPIVAYIAGESARPGVRMGHTGALVTSPGTEAGAKIDALMFAGARIARSLDAIIPLLLEAHGRAS